MSSTDIPAGFRIDAIPRMILEEIWSTGCDPFGNTIEVMVNEEAESAPLRCCLKEATVGEAVGLIAYGPLDKPGPYAEVGPVFIHPTPCNGYEEPYRYPVDFRHRRQVLRVYDGAGRMLYDLNRIVEGDEAEAAIATVLQDPRAAVVHSRNVVAGCYMFAIRRTQHGSGPLTMPSGNSFPSQ